MFEGIRKKSLKKGSKLGLLGQKKKRKKIV